ncbi:MAG TPA: hypothetical protein VK205_11155 [Prolixibacteraceae bacterium]|nr:hypothetical protein [Prolixibacteraceae bacterium]
MKTNQKSRQGQGTKSGNKTDQSIITKSPEHRTRKNEEISTTTDMAEEPSPNPNPNPAPNPDMPPNPSRREYEDPGHEHTHREPSSSSSIYSGRFTG